MVTSMYEEMNTNMICLDRKGKSCPTTSEPEQGGRFPARDEPEVRGEEIIGG